MDLSIRFLKAEIDVPELLKFIKTELLSKPTGILDTENPVHKLFIKTS